MKFFLTFLLTTSSFAGSVALKKYDQRKIALTLGELPTTVRDRTIIRISSPVSGIKVTNVFDAGGMKFLCESFYYLNSPHPTDGNCKITLDMKDPNVSAQNNEIKFTMTEKDKVKAFYEAIPYGRPEKDQHGWERDNGVNFEGLRAPIFHYRINCSPARCEFIFSSFQYSA
jgi:hypothetical protein